MSTHFQGVDGHRALFNVDGKGVVVNTRSLTASVVPFDETAMSRFWVDTAERDKVPAWGEVARCEVYSLSDQGDVLVAGSDAPARAYTVPKSVRESASDALTRASQLTASARVAANLLTEKTQLEIDDIRLLARYFSSNPTDRGSRTWRAWGGDSGSRWSASTVAKQPLTAASAASLDASTFYAGDDDERTFFGQRSADQLSELYRKSSDSRWEMWFNGTWNPAPVAPKKGSLVELDDDSAVFLAASFYDSPGRSVAVRDLDPEAHDIFTSAVDGIDFATVDASLTRTALRAAGAEDDYTKDERSANASKQLRDANGRFAQIGDVGVVKASGLRGTVKALNPVDNSLLIEAEDGNSYSIPPNEFEVGGEPSSLTRPPVESKLPPLNLDRILGQPRATKTTPKAMLKRVLQPMGPAQLKKVVTDYEQFIRDERQKRADDFRGGTGYRENPTKSEKRNEDKIEDDLNKDINRYNRKYARENALEEGDPPAIEKLDPDSSDVKPLYLAIVDRDDPQAVTDLVALVPASTGDDRPTTYRRVGGAWVEDAKMLQDIKSPTPPPVVQLDESMYADVLSQVDSSEPDEADGADPGDAAAPVVASGGDDAVIPLWGPNAQLAALVAAGGADRNRGNAEKLRRYWLYGPGAAKIRWGTDGDWKRCVRLLSKHLGTRAKGYCALRHHEATGMWTGDKRHAQSYGIAPGDRIFSTTEDIVPRADVLIASADMAKVRSLQARVYGVGDAGATEPEYIEPDGGGRRFTIPLVLPEGLESGDGRTFDVGSLSMRSFPLPLMWQVQTGDGHDGSYLVGRIDKVERTAQGLGNATGVMDTGPWGQEAQRLIEAKMLRWISADLDRFEAEEVAALSDGDDDGDIGGKKLRIKKGRLMGATLVSKPAYQECVILFEPEGEIVPINDGVFVSNPAEADAQAIVAAGSIALNIPVVPPETWFENPRLKGPTPLHTDDNGHVFGHIATWDRDHIGLPGSRRAPRSLSNYSFFHTGVVRTDSGADKPVGQLTLAGGHADITADASAAVRHYDDTGSAIADVHAGEDSYGIWVAGALRPGTTPEQIRSLRASAPSGDWRVIDNRLELVAVCQVNVPGFPIQRSMVASGAVTALVAAGAQTLATMKSDPISELQQRMNRLEEYERRQDADRARAALSKLQAARDKRDERKLEMTNMAASARARVFKALDAQGYLSEFKAFTPEQIETLVKNKQALSDGSFPVQSAADLRRAIAAYDTLSDETEKSRVRRHLVRQALSLDTLGAIPADWNERNLSALALNAQDSREVLTAAANQNRAERARAMTAAARAERDERIASLSAAREAAIKRIKGDA